MSWDVALSPDGDLIFSAGRDLEYVDGNALMNQRLITRLRLVRGSWLFDDSGTLGSRLDLALSQDMTEAPSNIEGYVREALDPIRDEIQIHDIVVTPHELGQMEVLVEYLWLVPDIAPAAREISQLVVII